MGKKCQKQKHPIDGNETTLTKMDEDGQKFMSTRKQMSVILEQWVIDAIDKVSKSDIAYGACVRELVETWAKSQNP